MFSLGGPSSFWARFLPPLLSNVSYSMFSHRFLLVHFCNIQTDLFSVANLDFPASFGCFALFLLLNLLHRTLGYTRRINSFLAESLRFLCVFISFFSEFVWIKLTFFMFAWINFTFSIFFLKCLKASTFSLRFPLYK